MTATLDRPPAATLAERIPAWGISVDLTPQETINGRRIKMVRRLVVLGLILVLLACAGLAVLAYGSRAVAKETYNQAQQKTAALQNDSHQYDGLVTATAVQQQNTAASATLMAQDVDLVNLVAKIRSELPTSVLIDNLAVLLAPAAPPVAAAVAGSADPTATDPSTTTAAPPTPATTDTGATIGTITISGSGDRIKALAPFVASLNHTPGITGVVPTSTTQTATGMVYSLTMNFTDELYTHRFSAAGTP